MKRPTPITRTLIENPKWIKTECARCHRTYWVVPSKFGVIIYCCETCNDEPWETRLWKNVIREEHPKGCWLFKLKANVKGYPLLKRNGKEERVSRLMWEFHHGPIPEGLQIRHTCDNPKCVNIDHLLTGTAQDNANDRVARNRTVKGEKHSNAALTETQVREIMALKGKGMLLREVAEMFGVGMTTICELWKGKRWKHVDAVAAAVVIQPTSAI